MKNIYDFKQLTVEIYSVMHREELDRVMGLVDTAYKAGQITVMDHAILYNMVQRMAQLLA